MNSKKQRKSTIKIQEDINKIIHTKEDSKNQNRKQHNHIERMSKTAKNGQRAFKGSSPKSSKFHKSNNTATKSNSANKDANISLNIPKQARHSISLKEVITKSNNSRSNSNKAMQTGNHLRHLYHLHIHGKGQSNESSNDEGNAEDHVLIMELSQEEGGDYCKGHSADAVEVALPGCGFC